MNSSVLTKVMEPLSTGVANLRTRIRRMGRSVRVNLAYETRHQIKRWGLRAFFRVPIIRGRRFGISVLDRYVFLEILQIFLVSVLLFTALLMSLVLKQVVGELLGKDIELLKILEYLGYLLVEKVPMTIPLSGLFAGILASGRLSGESEITAMRSAGISYPRIYAVFVFFGLLSGTLVAYINLYYGPISSMAREDFESWLKSYHSLTLVKPGRFLGGGDMDGVSKKGQDIYAENRVDNVLKHVQIREWYNTLDPKKSRQVRVNDVTLPIGDGVMTQILDADEGELLLRKNQDGTESNLIRLTHGYLIERNEENGEIQVTDFLNGYMDYVIPPPAKPIGRLNVKPDNYTFLELFDFIDKLDNGGHKINLCSLSPTCDMEAQSAKVSDDEASTEEGGEDSMLNADGIFTLPSVAEMELMRNQLAIWLAKNAATHGTEEGPSNDEYQMRVQLFMQFNVFIKEAGNTRPKFQTEIHKRLATPLASVIFFFISFPLGLVARRSGKGMGFVLALGVYLLYYILLTFGISQAYSGAISPALGAWAPDIIIAILGFVIMSRRTEGFAPLAFVTGPLHRFLAWCYRPIAGPVDRFMGLPPVLRVRGVISTARLALLGIIERIVTYGKSRLEALLKRAGFLKPTGEKK